MLISELKPQEEILGFLKGKENLFLVGCSGCAEVCKTGGEAQVEWMAEELVEAGKKITGRVSVDFLCSKALAGVRLRRRIREVDRADGLLVMSCGIGVQAVAAIVDRPVYPAANTMSVGGHQGVWRGDERCAQCGDCVLHMTGGICPVTFCSKGMLNGPCGGYSSAGKCEVDPQMNCGWVMIYNRLKTLGQLDRFKQIVEAKRRAKMRPPAALRSTAFWAVEQKDGIPAKAEGALAPKSG